MFKKSKKFAVRIVRLYNFLTEHKEYVVSKQVLRSGTSIGANLAEGKYAQSSADFMTKLNIALKEASETEYWLEILHETGLLTDEQYKSISEDCSEIIKMLIAGVRSLKTSSNVE